MTFEDFLTVDADRAAALSPQLAALALDRAGQWSAAHARAAEAETPATNRIHAYLHRKEGDLTNAGYWYDRVGEAMPTCSLDDEWNMLVRRFL